MCRLRSACPHTECADYIEQHRLPARFQRRGERGCHADAGHGRRRCAAAPTGAEPTGRNVPRRPWAETAPPTKKDCGCADWSDGGFRDPAGIPVAKRRGRNGPAWPPPGESNAPTPHRSFPGGRSDTRPTNRPRTSAPWDRPAPARPNARRPGPSAPAAPARNATKALARQRLQLADPGNAQFAQQPHGFLRQPQGFDGQGREESRGSWGGMMTKGEGGRGKGEEQQR